MTDENIALIQTVIRTLDSIPVQGLEPMNRLLGCAKALQQLLAEAAASNAPVEQAKTEKR